MYRYNYFELDPVFLKLSLPTVNALYQANIKCLEDLFELDKSEIGSLQGIGKKRSKEILYLLYGLPFDYMDASLPRNPEQNPYAGVHPRLEDILSNILFSERKLLKRGIDYFQNGRVSNIKQLDEKKQCYEIKINGSSQYLVTLNLETNPSIHCTCPSFGHWGYDMNRCKHVIAAIIALAEQQRLMRFEKTGHGKQKYRQLLYNLDPTKSLFKPNNNSRLDYLLVFEQGNWDLYPKKLYPFVRQLKYFSQWNNPWQKLKPSDPRDRLIISYLRKIYMPEFLSYDERQQDYSFGDVLELLDDHNVYLKYGNQQLRKINFQETPFTLSTTIEHLDHQHTDNDDVNSDLDSESDLYLTFCLNGNGTVKDPNEVMFICTDPCWVISGNTLARLNGTDQAIKFFLNAPGRTTRIPTEETQSFFQEVLPKIQDIGIPVHLADDFIQQKEVSPVPRLYLSETSHNLLIELRVAYDDYEIRYEDSRTRFIVSAKETNDSTNEPRLWSVERNMALEEHFINQLKETGLESTAQYRTFTPKDSALEWVVESLPELAEDGYEIFGQQQLKQYHPPRKLTSSSLSVMSAQQWFELQGSMSFGEMSIDMNDIHRVLIGKKYVRLIDGSTGEIPDYWLDRIKKILHLIPANDKKKRIPKIAASAIEELGDMVDDFETDVDFKEYVKKFREFNNIKPVKAPQKFNGKLRPYQLAGLSWLCFLHEYDIGGILADDMGLGKTVQVLALLRKLQELSGKKTNTLVIAPRSVIHNWQMEANRFIPDYSVYIHHDKDRVRSSDDWPEADISITTYGTLRNDYNFLADKKFDYIILDESHTIRNPSSKTFQAIRRLNGSNRLCLTGTPIQNTTMDLWSQFEFINPGLLGGQKNFREQWVKPLEQYNDQTAEEMLHKMVAPFILRRTKRKVASELPPLETSQIDCPMDLYQQHVYEKYRQIYYQMVNKAIDAEGIRESQFVVLEGLTRLRQICCSPRLIKGETGTSAKIKRFTELADELIKEGHRALVFSQFVGFLRQIEKEVINRGWEYEYLDGQTRNRQERVDRFQSDLSKSLFLISLKAGGEGLNLTGADYVFLMDPWWNPAAERQAMDRTHRIGQTEHVFVYRFVCPDTVEEKILKLQERKRSLAQKLVVAESGIFKQLKRDDIIALFE